MKKMITNRRKLALASFLAFAAALCALAVVAAGNIPRPAATAPDPLPSMTLTYEVPGAGVSVGDRVIEDYRETIRLEYRGKNDWTETVISSPMLDLGRYGTGTNEGSYRTVNGNTIIEYDAMVGDTSTYTRDGGGTELPNVTFGVTNWPVASPLGPTIIGVSVTTDARVCINGDCQDNAPGVKYTKDGIDLVVLSGVDFTLPLKNGDFFILKSATINGQ